MPFLTSAPDIVPSRSSIPTGSASLAARQAYLRRRSRRRIPGRGITAIWLTVGALLSWLFVVGFSSLTH